METLSSMEEEFRQHSEKYAMEGKVGNRVGAEKGQERMSLRTQEKLDEWRYLHHR